MDATFPIMLHYNGNTLCIVATVEEEYFAFWEEIKHMLHFATDPVLLVEWDDPKSAMQYIIPRCFAAVLRGLQMLSRKSAIHVAGPSGQR